VTSIFAALIAITGTLLGSSATFYFQRHTTDCAATLAFAARIRQDRLETYIAFAGAAIRYRQSELDR
jgi:hypothetical protein